MGAKIGPYHADVNGRTSTGDARGPFDVVPLKSSDAPTYPVLWSHNAAEERTIVFGADSQGMPRKGATASEQTVINQKVTMVWASASHLHFNRDFRYNSQSTGMQFTPKKTIGGRAWISIQLDNQRQEKAMALWANTSIGFLLQWQHANRQQSGRGSIGVQTLRSLPVLDVKALSASQLDAAEKLFKDFANQELLPIYQLDQDAARRELDERFCKEVLGLPAKLLGEGGPLDLLRQKLAAEPSVRGGKSLESADDEEDALED
jgi:hypothetical protein